MNQLIDNKKEVILPKSESDKELANGFLTYFKEKVEKNCASFSTSSGNVAVEEVNHNVEMLSTFAPATADEVKEIWN